ncbi:MAG: hypothetical protein IJV21_02550 [Lachnospiraceae bacterium]|nr:hypothetical protein [Lachnospiraceae bacterium]
MAVEEKLHLIVARFSLHLLPTLAKINIIGYEMVEELGGRKIRQRNNS